jgi:hypothetical protein
MKLDISEVAFCKAAVESVNVKAHDARALVSLMDKLDKELERLQSIEEKKATPQE